jgi:putative component of toxin-antitoxin plasmid stabilization module
MSVTLQDIKEIYDKIDQQRSDFQKEVGAPLNNLAAELGKLVSSFNSHQKAIEKQEKAQSKITEKLENVQEAQALEIAKLREEQTNYRIDIGKAITKIYTTQQGFLGVINKVALPLLLALQSAGALIIYLKMASG